MHNRTISSSSIESQSRAWEVDETRHSVISDGRLDTDTHRFREMLAGLHLTPNSSADSPSAAAGPYSLVRRPPVIEITSSSFKQKIQEFHGAEIKYIAANPQEYSPFVSSKAERTVSLAEGSGTARRHTD